MNQEIQPLFEVDAMKVALGSTPDSRSGRAAQASAVLGGVQAPHRGGGQRLPSAGGGGSAIAPGRAVHARSTSRHWRPTRTSSPRTVFAMLLDAGRYLASVSTFYRLLRDLGRGPRAAQ